jgi:hypothetical protein
VWLLFHVHGHAAGYADQRDGAALRARRSHVKLLLALFPPTLAHTMEVSSATSDQKMDTAQHDSAKWWTQWRLTRNSSRADAKVALWKTAWLRGANAVWQHQNKSTNPYDQEMQRAAWQAGARWARENPDRRTNGARRFAHPQRRASDAKLPAIIKRAVAVSATSLTLYAISKTLWRAKRTPDDAA